MKELIFLIVILGTTTGATILGYLVGRREGYWKGKRDGVKESSARFSDLLK